MTQTIASGSSGMINHVALAVTDITKSEERFYGPLLRYLGYANVLPLAQGNVMSVWLHKGSGTQIVFFQAAEKHRGTMHERYSLGLQHLALNAASRTVVEEACKKVEVVLGPEAVVDQPAEYPYNPGYYAAFVKDPDGIVIELTHSPAVKYPTPQSE